MRIEVQKDAATENVRLEVYGAGGDEKQPISRLYFSIVIPRTAALKVALAMKQAAEPGNLKSVQI